MSDTTIGIARCVAELQNGETAVRGELLNHAYARLLAMTRKIKRQYQRVGRWEQTEDILQNASLRLYEALHDVQVTDVRHFYRLAALQIRRELIDMCRHYHGPLGQGARITSRKRKQGGDEASAQPRLYDRAETTEDPRKMQEWAEFHATVQDLPEREREVVDLLWYHGLTQEEAAQVLGVSSRQVKRIWRAAKLSLHDRLQGEVPGI